MREIFYQRWWGGEVEKTPPSQKVSARSIGKQHCRNGRALRRNKAGYTHVAVPTAGQIKSVAHYRWGEFLYGWAPTLKDTLKKTF